MRFRLNTAVLVLSLVATVAAASVDDPPLRVVPEVNYDRYAGTWYEIARLPNRFEKACARDITATYTRREDGRIDVENKCVEADGRVKVARGVARPVEGQPSSVLQVRFAPAFLSFIGSVWGDYQIIALGPGYDHAVVGTPDRKFLWVLARTPKLDAAVYKAALDQARSQNFDVSKMLLVPQTGS